MVSFQVKILPLVLFALTGPTLGAENNWIPDWLVSTVWQVDWFCKRSWRNNRKLGWRLLQ